MISNFQSPSKPLFSCVSDCSVKGSPKRGNRWRFIWIPFINLLENSSSKKKSRHSHMGLVGIPIKILDSDHSSDEDPDIGIRLKHGKRTAQVGEGKSTGAHLTL